MARSSPPRTNLEAPAPPDQAIDTSGPQPPRKRRAKSYTSWTSEHFYITTLETTWSRNGKDLKKDRLFKCKRCSWSSTDSARRGSTTNLATHLYKKHRIKQESTIPSSSMTTLDQFVRPSEPKLDMEQALLRLVVETMQPFTVVEQPTFKALFDAAGLSLPIRSADTLRNLIQADFVEKRSNLQRDLAVSCSTVALSLDLWASEHEKPIVGIIGHWITPDFEKREELLEFTEIHEAHSRENLTEVFLPMLEELQIAQKLLTVTGDNAGNSKTLCDSLHAELLKTYGDENDQSRLKPLMQFRGRDSFIPCLAHIINLVCADILQALKAGTVREANKTLDDLEAQKTQSFANTFTTKSAIVKIRLLVLWIARSPERRREWRKVSPSKQISYDVDTRWNSTFTMISEALHLRKEATQFTQSCPDVHALQLHDNEWSRLQQMYKVLRPFCDHTNTASKTFPTIVESLHIFWNLDDILDDIKKAEGDMPEDVQNAVGAGIQKLGSFMNGNILYYVTSVLDPRIKTSYIKLKMSEPDALLIISQVREFLRGRYSDAPVSPPRPGRPPNMPKAVWRTLKKIQPTQSTPNSDID